MAAHETACRVRNEEADETDDPREGDGGGSQERGGDVGDSLDRLDRHAERQRGLVAERQRIESPSQGKQYGRADESATLSARRPSSRNSAPPASASRCAPN